jgi:hypothetical protein
MNRQGRGGVYIHVICKGPGVRAPNGLAEDCHQVRLSLPLLYTLHNMADSSDTEELEGAR